MTRRVVLAVAFVVAAAVLVGCGPVDPAAGPTATPTASPTIARQSATVAKIVDGDTLWLEGHGAGPLPDNAATSVRLLLIDSPERTKVRFGHVECYGEEAKAALAGLAPVGSTVTVEADEDPTDRYGRLLLYVWAGDRLVNAELARLGAGKAVVYRPNDARIAEVREAEAQARDARAGMWGAC